MRYQIIKYRIRLNLIFLLWKKRKTGKKSRFFEESRKQTLNIDTSFQISMIKDVLYSAQTDIDLDYSLCEKIELLQDNDFLDYVPWDWPVQ